MSAKPLPGYSGGKSSLETYEKEAIAASFKAAEFGIKTVLARSVAAVVDGFTDAKGPGIPSRPGRPPAKQTARLKASVRSEQKGVSGSVYAGGYLPGGLGEVDYAAIHEFGGPVRKKGGGTFMMPKRPYFKKALLKYLRRDGEKHFGEAYRAEFKRRFLKRGV